MRKMKKFLAVALSAAMVLSVSVPAMAAGENTNVSAASPEQQAYEAAKIKEAEAQEAHDKAKAELNAAIELLEEARKEQAKIFWQKPSDARINAAKGEIENCYDDVNTDLRLIDAAKDELDDAETAEKIAKQNFDTATTMVETATTTMKSLATEMAKVTEGSDKWNDLKKQYDEWEQVKKKNEALLNGTPDPDYNPGGTTNLTEAYKEAQEDTEYYEGELNRLNGVLATDKEELNEARKEYNKLLFLKQMVEEGLTSVQDAEEFVKEKQAAYEQAVKDLKEATDARIKAEKRIDEAGQHATELLYEQAVAANDAAKQVVQERQTLLDNERANLEAIEAEIAAQEALIKAYDDAVVAYDAAKKTAEDAAYALSAAEAKIQPAEVKYDAAVRGVNYIIPKRVSELQFQLNNAIATAVLDDFDAYKNSLAIIDDIREQLDVAMNEDPVLAGTVLDVAEYEYNKAITDWQSAAAAWLEAEVALEKAQNVVNNTFGDYQKAVTALYEYEWYEFDDNLKEVYRVNANINAIARPIGIYNDTKAAVRPLDRVGGTWVHLVNNVPETRNGKVRECTPNKLVVYAMDDIDPSYQVLTRHMNVYNVALNNLLDPDTAVQWGDIAEVNLEAGEPMPNFSNNGPVAYLTIEGEAVPYVRHFESPSVGAKLYTAAPYSLYAEEEFSKGTIVLLEDDLLEATVAQIATEEDLAEAAAEYALYHGAEPGEETPEEQREREAEEASQAEIIAKFSDVNEGDWFVPYVTHVYNKDIMTGMTETFFGVYNTLQRQDFVVMLWRMAGKPVVNYAVSFKDVDPNAYYAQAVAWAASKGIVRGYNKDEFGVGKDITREDFTVMLHRYYGYPQFDASIEGFADASNVSNYAEVAVKWAVGVGAITGKDNGTKIDPQAKIARCEAAKIIDIITG